jgi:hypothetical protein
MSDTHSSTHDVSGLADSLIGTHTFRTDISDNDRHVSGYGGTREEAEEHASDKWDDD